MAMNEGELVRLDILRAKAERDRAEAAKLDVEAALGRSALEQTTLLLAKAKRAEAQELAANRYHHVYVFDGTVCGNTVDKCIDQLTQWMRNEPGCPIEIILFSPGGEVIAGMALFDFIQRVRHAGHHVTMTALGMAASMAGILLQAGDKRIIGRQAYVLIHEISAGAVGKIGELEDEVTFIKKIQKRVLDIFVKRASVSRAYFVRNWRRKDWWLDSDECMRIGFVDEIQG